jgi:Domain of unknown function (DUF4402)
MSDIVRAGILALGLCCVSPFAAADQGGAAVSVTVPITVTSGADLYFGAFTKGSTFNSGVPRIELEADGELSYVPTSAFVPLPSAVPHIATFTISGAPNFDIVVDLPVGTFPLGAGMQLRNLDTTAAFGNPHSLPPSGTETFPVGGVLRVHAPGSVTVGYFSVNFPVTVQYY